MDSLSMRTRGDTIGGSLNYRFKNADFTPKKVRQAQWPAPQIINHIPFVGRATLPAMMVGRHGGLL